MRAQIRAGTLIRERRRGAGLTQTALAKRAGISPSYLNLIENNRRPAAGKVLHSIARALDVAPASLSEGAELALIGTLQEAAAEHGDAGEDAGRIDALLSRFPEWARVIERQQLRLRELDATMSALSDRLAHDPVLAETLHALLSSVTAIRAGSGILSTVDDITPMQRKRFLDAINEESQKLSEKAQSLISFLEGPAETVRTSTPDEALSRFLAERKYRIAELEDDPTSLPIVLAGSGLDGLARSRAAMALSRYAQDAEALPLASLEEALKQHAYAPDRAASQLGAPLALVLRRMARLEIPGVSPLATITVLPSGQVLDRKPVADFPLSAQGSGCPLWPVFAAFSEPLRPRREAVALTGGLTFTAISATEPLQGASLEASPRLSATMLVIRQEDGLPEGLRAPAMPALPVGISCRTCPRASCAARAEPALVEMRP